METNTPRKSSKLTLCVMTLMVLLVSASSFYVSAIMSDWYNISEIIAICLVAIILCTLSYFIVRYGFLHHSVKQSNLPMLAIITAALILISFLIAYLIGTHILHEDIINGKYPFNEFSYADRSDYKGMRIGCILGSLIVFGGSSAAMIAYKQRISTKLLSIGAVISTIILFVLSLYVGFNVRYDKSWYYGNEKVLAYNTNECYDNAVAAYELCCKYNDEISKEYESYMYVLLNVFDDYSQSKLDSMTLKRKQKSLEGWKDLLLYNANVAHDPVSKEIFKHFWNEYKSIHNNISQAVDSAKLQLLRDKYIDYKILLQDMDCSKMNNSQDLNQKNTELLSLVDKIDEFVFPFTFYRKFPVETKHSLVTWEGQERREEIDSKLEEYNERYNPKQ